MGYGAVLRRYWRFLKKMLPKISVVLILSSLRGFKGTPCEIIISRSSQYASNGMHSITGAAHLKQLEAVKVGPPGSNYDYFACLCVFWLVV